MGNEKELISLKDAAKLSGYSPDYIGQLIRGGKIPGKQVYCNIQWMTTAKAVLEYKAKKAEKKGRLKESLKVKYQKLLLEFNIIKLFFNTFKSSLPIIFIILISFIILSFYLFYIFTANHTKTNIQTQKTENTITF